MRSDVACGLLAYCEAVVPKRDYHAQVDPNQQTKQRVYCAVVQQFLQVVS